MNRTNYRVTLDIKEIYSPFTVSVKRGDTSGRLLITLMSGGKPYQIPTGSYATFESTRPDGAIIHHGCIIQNNMIVYDIEKDVSRVAGKLPCEITLYDLEGMVLVSPQFAIMVYDTVFSQEEVEASQEYKSLTNLISDANALVNEFETKLENGDFIGEQGEKGEKGEQGEKGEKGDKGEQGNRGIGVSTAEDGEPSVEGEYTITPVKITLTDNTEKTIYIKAKRGEKGEKGEKGDKGEKGADGVGGVGGEMTPSEIYWIDTNGESQGSIPEDIVSKFILNHNSVCFKTADGYVLHFSKANYGGEESIQFAIFETLPIVDEDNKIGKFLLWLNCDGTSNYYGDYGWSYELLPTSTGGTIDEETVKEVVEGVVEEKKLVTASDVDKKIEDAIGEIGEALDEINGEVL